MHFTMKSVQHAVAAFVAFGLPFVITSGQPVLTMTVGTILTFIYHVAVAFNTTTQ
jgi:hypothetical protein